MACEPCSFRSERTPPARSAVEDVVAPGSAPLGREGLQACAFFGTSFEIPNHA